MMIANNLFWFIVFIPLLGSFCVSRIDESHGSDNIKNVTVWTTLFVLCLSFGLLINEERTPLLYTEKFSLNGMSVSFIIVTSALMFVSSLIGRKEIHQNVKSFYILMLLLQSLLVTLFATTNLLLFYILFELILVVAFIQLGIFTKGAICASKFLIILTFGALLILFGVIYIFGITGTTDINALSKNEFTHTQELIIFSVMFIGFACKTALFPVHIWLPDAHTQAPTSMSVILSGVILKIGAFGMLRILLPIAHNSCQECQHIVLIVAILTIIYAVIAALSQKDLKRIIAYISIAHMGIITVGIFSFDINGVTGAFYNMIAHSFVIPMLFVIAHVIELNFKTRNPNNISGIVTTAPYFSAIALIPILAVISTPGLPCFSGEFLILLGIIESHFKLSIALCFLIMCSMFYFFRIYQKIFFGEKIQKNFTISVENIVSLALMSFGIIILCAMPYGILSALAKTLKIMVLVK